MKKGKPMKRKIVSILLTAILVLSCCGCGSGEEKSQGETQSLREAINALSAAAIKDNSLDAYSMVQNAPLQVEEPEGALGGGVSNLFMGSSRAFYFKKHLLGSAKESWDELAFVTGDGEEGSSRFEWGRLSWNDQLWGAGPVAGSDHYLALNIESPEEDSYRYFFTERDEDGQKLRAIPLEVPDGKDIAGALGMISLYAMDSTGTVHLVWHTSGGWNYQLISPEGEVLAEYDPRGEEILDLVPLSDGRVAFCSRKIGKEETENFLGDGSSGAKTFLRYLDAESGEAAILASSDASAYSCTLLDENQLIYADSNGIYLGGMPGQEPKPLYLWVNHGISMRDVPLLQTDGPDRIRLVYEDLEGYHYLCLEPTVEEVEICEITLAVSPYNESALKPMVVEFNKKYPGCHINIKSDYEGTELLTELAAGDGPVLIDTWLTGFQEQEKLWQPLDDMMEELGISEAMVPTVQEAGKINGIQYGVSTDFTIYTLVTAGQETEDWDYDAFIKCIEDRPDLEAVFNVLDEGYGSYFIMFVLGHGVDDSYFWDAEAGTTDFDSEKFREALEIAKEYVDSKQRIEQEEAAEMLLDGRMLCMEYNMWHVEDIIEFRLAYGEKFHLTGYPTGDGAAHLIDARNPLAVRKTASDKEKLVAYAFLDMCLSYEGQRQAVKNNDFYMSVRDDVLKEELFNLGEDRRVRLPSTGEEFILRDEFDPEQDGKTLQDLLDRSKPRTAPPKELRDILFEELDRYFDGTITQDQLINNLENRVGLYFEERK